MSQRSKQQHPGVIGGPRLETPRASLQIITRRARCSVTTIAFHECQRRFRNHHVYQSEGNARQYHLGYDWHCLLRSLPAGGRQSRKSTSLLFLGEFRSDPQQQTMHQGVIRDMEQQRIKRERQVDFEMQRQLEEEYRKVQTVSDTTDK